MVDEAEVKAAKEAVHDVLKERIEAALAAYSVRSLVSRPADQIADDIVEDLVPEQSERTRGARARGGADIKKQKVIARDRARAVSLWLATFLDEEPSVRAFRAAHPTTPVPPSDFQAWRSHASPDALEALKQTVDILRARQAPWSTHQAEMFVVTRAVPEVPPLRAELLAPRSAPVTARRLHLDIDPSLPPDVVSAILGEALESMPDVRNFPSSDALPRMAEFVWQRWSPGETPTGDNTATRAEWNTMFPNASYDTPEGFESAVGNALDWIINVHSESVAEERPPKRSLDAFLTDGTGIGTLDSLRTYALGRIQYPTKRKT